MRAQPRAYGNEAMTIPVEPAHGPAIDPQISADEARPITRSPQDRQTARSKYAAAAGWALLLVSTACLLIYSLPALPVRALPLMHSYAQPPQGSGQYWAARGRAGAC